MPSGRKIGEHRRESWAQKRFEVLPPAAIGRAWLASLPTSFTTWSKVYRPELHYMRGPGPKWRAKHERALRIDPDARMYAPAQRAIRPHNPALTLRIAIVAIVLLITPGTASKADTSYCGQVSDLAAARLRWAAARQSRLDPAQDEQKCRAWGFHFYDAVTARQAASVCEDGSDRQRDLDLLDSEIDALNNLIAAQCGG